ncbi:porin [Xanthobacter sp. KR7-225]|uniref:porin n=1 Tax=Xanthobacter sp. KR7-225 TaxID=3156613 RepID=UPI0032B60E8A
MKRTTLIVALVAASCGTALGADLPIKAQPAEHVKICSAYGAGYFYVPGTDTCLKIGGYVRFDTYINSIATFTPLITPIAGAAFNGPGAGAIGFPFRDADDGDLFTRTRAVFDMDARTQSEYGTLRSYVRMGMSWDTQTAPGSNPGTSLYFERAFVQFSGFTFGYVQSFFDLGLNYMYTTPIAGSSRWTTALAYTAMLGNGLSATLSLEDAANRTTGVQMAGSTPQAWNNISTTTTGLGYASYQAGQDLPDLVGNIRLDQSWGSALLSGAVHQVKVEDPLYAGYVPGLASSGAWGWAVGAGAEIRLPALANGDSLFLQAGYASGAAAYLGLSGSSQGLAQGLGLINLTQIGAQLSGSGAFYTVADAVATNLLGDYALTSGWSLSGQLRHYWIPVLRSTIYAGYVSYDVPANIVAASDFSLWQVGLNTIWSPVRNLEIGAEILYTKLDGSIPLGNYAAVSGSGSQIGSLMGGSVDTWSGGFRVQRSF